MTDNRNIVTVFGTSKAAPGDSVFELAENVGRLLAENGFAIANGGYGGTMVAAAKGAAGAGGKVIGVTCRAFKRGKANEYVTEEIQTDCLAERLGKLVELGDAYLVLPGGTGTLLELADVWEHKNKGFANTDKPIILVGAFWQPLVGMMVAADTDSVEHIECAETAEDAVELLKMNMDTKRL
ncbi:MAG: LOG family protein [Planctomycetes bacterium]|nr:LOG family protein [Planctomycetota bacterium]